MRYVSSDTAIVVRRAIIERAFAILNLRTRRDSERIRQVENLTSAPLTTRYSLINHGAVRRAKGQYYYSYTPQYAYVKQLIYEFSLI